MKVSLKKNELRAVIKILNRVKTPAEAQELRVWLKSDEEGLTVAALLDEIQVVHRLPNAEVSQAGMGYCDARLLDKALGHWKRNTLLSLRLSGDVLFIVDENGEIEDVPAGLGTSNVEFPTYSSLGLLTTEDWIVSLKELLKTTNAKHPIEALGCLNFNHTEAGLAGWSVDGSSFTKKTMKSVFESAIPNFSMTKGQAESLIRVFNESKERLVSLDVTAGSFKVAGENLCCLVSMGDGLVLPDLMDQPYETTYSFKRQSFLTLADSWRAKAKGQQFTGLNDVFISSVLNEKGWNYDIFVAAKPDLTTIKGPTLCFNLLAQVVKDSPHEDWTVYIPKEAGQAVGLSYTLEHEHYIRWFMPMAPSDVAMEDEELDEAVAS